MKLSMSVDFFAYELCSSVHEHVFFEMEFVPEVLQPLHPRSQLLANVVLAVSVQCVHDLRFNCASV